MTTVYKDLFTPSEVNELEKNIMRFVAWWAREKKTPIPLRKIIKEMEHQSINDFTTIKALNALLRKGYIRRAIIISNKTSFVQLRGVI